MLGDDLFPRDFIHVLEQPTNYVGMNALFPGEAPEGQPAETTSVRTITDGEDWLPEKHDKDFKPGALPESLQAALCTFLLTCTIRDLRAADVMPGRGGPIHRSMLVNVSRFTAVQDSVADALHVVLEDIRRSVRLHGALPPEQAASQSPEIAALAAIFERECSTCGAAWPRVLAALHDAIAPVRVQAVNQRTGAASLDYGVTDKPPGVRVIAVGGNSLSRGLTLEGLSTSYFRRDPRAYDTLLQMGRWFGYREVPECSVHAENSDDCGGMVLSVCHYRRNQCAPPPGGNPGHVKSLSLFVTFTSAFPLDKCMPAIRPLL
jgi:hypothetical protein